MSSQELQEHTKITDRNALATILGNIKQESNFTANVCEGGARVLIVNVLVAVMVSYSGHP